MNYLLRTVFEYFHPGLQLIYALRNCILLSNNLKKQYNYNDANHGYGIFRLK